MNYKKLILVGCISAFVAGLTSIMGVTGTVIGSVISSVLYNMLSEALEAPVSAASINRDFEWEVAYVFPLVVIGLIQMMLILAMLSEFGILPYAFLNAFLSLQQFTDNNLYRILGIAMLVISIYPLVLKPDIIKKSHGAIIAFVGLIFLARGFVDLHNSITDVYNAIFIYFDFPIALIAFILIIFVILKILSNAHVSDSRVSDHSSNEESFLKHNMEKVRHSRKHDDFDYMREDTILDKRRKRVNKIKEDSYSSDVKFKHRNNHKIFGEKTAENNNESADSGINTSSKNIHFESNDLLDDYKK